jgi:profilin
MMFILFFFFFFFFFVNRMPPLYYFPYPLFLHLQVSTADAKKILAAFSNPADVLANGIHLGADKYMTIKTDDRSVYGKKGATGVVCVKTSQAILIGQYDETIQPGQAATTVERLADYLIDNGM